MTKNIENLKIDAMRQQIETLQKENMRLHRMLAGQKSNNFGLTAEYEQLKKDNKILSDELTYFKELAADYEDKLNNVTLWDLSPEAQEEAGRALARSLLGGA